MAKVFWSLLVLSPELVSDERRKIEAYLNKEFVNKERQARLNELQIVQDRLSEEEKGDKKSTKADDLKERYMKTHLDEKVVERAQATDE